MDVTGKNAALVMLTFLQADCKNAEYRTELLSLVQEINPARDINWNGLSDDPMDDGFLEADGHHISNITALRDILPSVELQQPAVQQLAEELRVIADQFDQQVVAQATQGLRRKISAISSPDMWEEFLSIEVEKVMKQGVILKDVAQEQIMMALTLTLVKKVCEQTPQVLRKLFNTALQFMSHKRAM